MASKRTPTDRLIDLAGRDPSKKLRGSKALLQEIQDELRKEELETLKKELRTALIEAGEIRKQAVKLESEFKKNLKKLDDDLNSKINAIAQRIDGIEVQEPAKEEAEAATTVE